MAVPFPTGLFKSSAGKRYWRVEFAGGSTFVDEYIGIYEIAMRIATVDQTSPAAAAASVNSSKPLGFSDSFPDDNAFDDVVSTRWVTNYPAAATEWIQWDFGVGMSVNLTDVTILVEDDNHGPVSVVIKYSADGVSFTTAHTTSGMVAGDWTGYSTVAGTPKVFTI
jgi:hypothetical protein